MSLVETTRDVDSTPVVLQKVELGEEDSLAPLPSHSLFESAGDHVVNGDHKEGLLPLPTEINPSTEFDDVIMVAQQGLPDDLESLDGNDRSIALIPVNEHRLDGDKVGDLEVSEKEPEVDNGEVTKEYQNAAFAEILKRLAQSDGDQVEKTDIEMGSALSSPLSSLPDLPTDLPPSPELPKKALPEAPASPPVNEANFPPFPAESSSAAAKRAATTKRMANGKPKTKSKRKNNPSHDDLESVSFSEEDTLRSIGDVKEDINEKPRKKHKKLKDPDGNPIRAPKAARKPVHTPKPVSDPAKATGKITSRAKVLTDEKIMQVLKGQTRDKQMAICQRARYAVWGKCTQCIAKAGGDSCRFRDFRVFSIDPDTAEIQGPGWFESAELGEEMTALPTAFNVPFDDKHIIRTERTVAPLLLPLTTAELRHSINKNAIKREVDAAKHRAVCDFCQSTIFSGYFLCKRCGRDFCLQCENYFSDTLDAMRNSPWALPDVARPRLHRCTAPPESENLADTKTQAEKVSRGAHFHVRPDLQPVSGFGAEQLKEHWLALVDFVLEGNDPEEDTLRLLGVKDEEPELQTLFRDWRKEQEKRQTFGGDRKPPLTDEEVAGLYRKRTHPSAEPIPDPAELEDLSLPFIFIPADRLTNETFDLLWSRGEPIVVDGAGENLKHSWTPDTFIERFGKELCYVVNCQNNVARKMYVGKFFGMWKDNESKKNQPYKLKDWPAAKDFQSAYPDLYNDFCDALPVPDYTRRDGVLNLYSHFPPGPTRPDIGPKMYNAFAGKEGPGGFGSTRLHMDVADAINIMLYASPRPDGQPGCAVWDLFRAEDADKIRKFLAKKYRNSETKFTDPIHSQHFYLNSDLRKELLKKHGVVSWRVYQYPGQAVCIPAGCAHQVCNLADCIKIALDFVSPHNVTRCQQLVQDFRKENYAMVWKEDVLQLYNVMWYAWLNSRETRARRRTEAVAEQAATAARAQHLASLQNGDHTAISLEQSSGAQDASPVRAGPLAAAVSSVRDERMQSDDLVNGDADDTIKPAIAKPIKHVNGNPAHADSVNEVLPVETPSKPNGDTIHSPGVGTSLAPAVNGHDPSDTTKRELSLRLLDAALSRIEPDPLPTQEERRPIPPPSPKPMLPPKSLSMKDMIKLRMLPIDLAVNAARAAMGEGAEDEEVELALSVLANKGGANDVPIVSNEGQMSGVDGFMTTDILAEDVA